MFAVGRISSKKRCRHTPSDIMAFLVVFRRGEGKLLTLFFCSEFFFVVFDHCHTFLGRERKRLFIFGLLMQIYLCIIFTSNPVNIEKCCKKIMLTVAKLKEAFY